MKRFAITTRSRRSLSVGIVIVLLWLKNVSVDPASFATKMQCMGSLSRAGRNYTVTPASSFDIIILAQNGLSPLQRLVRSIDDADYGRHQVNLTIVIAPNSPDDEKATYDWAQRLTTTSSSTAPADKIVLHPSFTSIKVITNAGNEGWWLHVWNPTSDDERAIILNDEIVLSPLWYEWIQTVNERYSELIDIAGFSLVRLDSAPQDNSQADLQLRVSSPFLYTDVGSSAFAPRAAVWRKFVGWASCSFCLKSNIGPVTNHWGQAFTTFMAHHDLYCMYPSPVSKPLALMYNTTAGRVERHLMKRKDGAALSCNLRDASLLQRFDTTMNAIAPPKDWNFVVITSAVGDYREPEHFEHFVGSLRKFYDGPVKMLIGDQSPEVLKDYLSNHNVQYETTDEGRSWREFNSFRFEFYSKSCSLEFDWCLALDFRDVKFQSNPFPMNVFRDGPESDVDLLLFAHKLNLNKWARGGRWFHKNVAKCGSFQGVDLPPSSSPLINAGGFFATPNGLYAVSRHIWEHPDCNDQVTLNMGVHLGLTVTQDATERPLKYTIFEQGRGPINNVAFKSEYTLDSLGQIGGSDCFASPVVHQYDRLYQSDILNPNCKMTP